MEVMVWNSSDVVGRPLENYSAYQIIKTKLLGELFMQEK